jgi:hypothetical protein
MWAPKGWEGGWMSVHPVTIGPSDIPVLVTSAEGMPDFAPGDRVQFRGYDEDIVYEVEGVYLDKDGRWAVVLYSHDGDEWDCTYPCHLTKLPREVTKLVRVTGTEDGVERTVQAMTSDHAFRVATDTGVRVEIVEDER